MRQSARHWFSLSDNENKHVKYLQSNLFIADMLYNEHLVIADPFPRNWPNHAQTLIEKPLYSGHFYSQYLLQQTFFFEHRVNFSDKISS